MERFKIYPDKLTILVKQLGITGEDFENIGVESGLKIATEPETNGQDRPGHFIKKLKKIFMSMPTKHNDFKTNKSSKN